jgi:tetratricopeptide (TPR) repeat protein
MEDTTGLTFCARDALGLRSRFARALAAAIFAILLCGGTAFATTLAEKARELFAEARTMAGEDRHGRAIACALAALELDPSLEDEAALLLANQYTWSDRPREAIPWYEKHLAKHPDDLEARRGLARALSWDDRLEEAGEHYEVLAAEDPHDTEALVGLARLEAWRGNDRAAAERAREVLAIDPENVEAKRILAGAENRRGRHREAERLYDEILAANPTDEEAVVGRARARFWMGEGSRAQRDLDGLESREAQDLRRAIDDSNPTTGSFGMSWFTDVDEQDLDTAFGRIDLGPDPQWTAAGEVRRDLASEPGSGDVEMWRFTGGGSHRFDRAWEIHAYGSAASIGAEQDVPAGEGEIVLDDDVDRTLALWDTWLTWTPADWTRFDLGAARVPIETPKALARGISIDLFSLGARRVLDDRFAAAAAGSYGDYSDDNEKIAGSISLEARPWLRRPLLATVGAQAFSFDRTTDHGYYNPETYDVLFTQIDVATDVTTWLHVEAFGRISSEKENDDDRFGVGGIGIDLTFRVTRAIELDVYGRTSTSRFESSAGYEREGWGFVVRLVP